MVEGREVGREGEETGEMSSGKTSQDLVSHVKKFGLYLLGDGKSIEVS